MTVPTDIAALSDTEIRALLPDHPDGPGCAIAILRAGQVERTFCYGNASIEHGAPIGPQTVFRIASVTKQFLCAGLLALADEGKLDLDAPLKRYLPDMHPVPGAATLRQAMANTSGIRDHLELWYIAGGGLQVPHRLRDSLALAMQQSETNFAPGARYLYSNANFLFLSQIAETAAGLPLEEYLTKRFFKPLGMTRTRLRSGHHDVIDKLATGYVVKDGDTLERGKMTAELWGEGSAHSCLEDLVKWLQYYRDDPDGLIARMRVPVAFSNGRPGFYGLGLFVDPWRGARRVGHYGLWPGYLTEIIWYDEPDVAFICLSNCNAIEPALINKRLAQRVIPDLQEPHRASVDPTAWQAACAHPLWINIETLDTATFSQDAQGALQLGYYGGQAALVATSHSEVAMDYGRSEYRAFDLAEADKGRVTVTYASGDRVILRPASARMSGTIDDLAGNWFAPDTQSTLSVAIRNGTIKVETPGFRGHDWISIPLPGGLLKIEEITGPWPRCFFLFRSGEDEVTLSGPRVRRMRYVRAA